MTNSTVADTAQAGNVATTAATGAAPRKPAPAAKAVPRPVAKAAVKPTARPPDRPVPKAISNPTATAATLPAPSTPEKPANKSSAAQKARKNAAPPAADKSAKPKKAKLVRDSFTMPEAEYDLIAALKKRCVAKGLAAKKSEVLRAAVIAFAAQSDANVAAAVQALAVIKTGRPPKALK